MKLFITLPALLGALTLSAATAGEHHDGPIDINTELRRIELRVALESYARILNLRSEASLDLALLALESGNANTAARRQAQQRRVQMLSKLAKETENRARQIHSQLQPHHLQPHDHPHDTFDDAAPERHDRDRWQRDPTPLPSAGVDVPSDDRPTRDDAFDQPIRDPGLAPTRDRLQPVDRPLNRGNIQRDVESSDDFAEPRDDGFQKPVERPSDEPTLESDDGLSAVLEDAIGP